MRIFKLNTLTDVMESVLLIIKLYCYHIESYSSGTQVRNPQHA